MNKVILSENNDLKIETNDIRWKMFTKAKSVYSCIVIFVLLPCLIYGGNIYYVSPNGSDSNPGTEPKPWKSMYHAGQSLRAGDIAIFENGSYTETKMVTFSNDGTLSEPIVLKARNKHKAKIYFKGLTAQDIYITKKHITIQNFELTQEQKYTSTSDQIIRIYPGGDNAKILGNKIHNAYEEGIKTYKVSNIIVDSNIIYDFTHEAIDFTPAHNSIIRNNEIFEFGRLGILIKAASRDVKIYNNYIHNNKQMIGDGYAIALGGSSDSNIISDLSGYEAYNCIAWNNIIKSETPGRIQFGLTMIGSIDCSFFHNAVIGVSYSFYTCYSSGTKKGWNWDPLVKNASYINNIVINCENSVLFKGIESEIKHDYNLYYNSFNAPSEAHSIYGDPKFVNIDKNDFHLQKDSPAIDAGVDVGITHDDIEGNLRPQGESYDIGPYEYQTKLESAAWKIYKTPTSINIDGDLSEFANTTRISFQDSSGRGSQDNKASAYLMWDDSNLYIGVEVYDSELNAIANSRDDLNYLWQDDCVEIFIDADNDGGNYMQTDDYRYTVNINDAILDGNGTGGGSQNFDWNGNAKYEVSKIGTLNFGNDTDTGYIVEMAIPFSDLGINPIHGHVAAIDIGVADKDDESSSYQFFDWRNLKPFANPNGWGKIELIADNLQTELNYNAAVTAKYWLAQNYPNPFNPVTQIMYSLPTRSKVKLIVYDLMGREIATLVNEEKNMGAYTVTFDGSDHPSGLYIYKLEAGNEMIVKKMTFLK